MQLTNNVLENNGGIFAGGIGLGQPYAHGSHNYNVRIANDRLIGNGGLTRSGGIGIFYGSNNYDVASSIVCSNFGVEYGAGISHSGLSPGRRDPRQPDLLQRRRRLAAPGSRSRRELPVGAAARSATASGRGRTSTAT